MKKRYLVLSDGTVFEGYAFGADKTVIGELIFNTNVVGYIETLTDPTYYGQIVLQTFPMIGNYGIIESDFIGETKLSGYVVREWCKAPSNFRCEYDIDKFLKEAWNMGGDANFDIDHDHIDDSQPSLFPENDIPSRIREFQSWLIERLKERPKVTDRGLYLVAVRNGMLASHAKEVVNKLRKEGFILNKKINVSYSNWAGKQPSVALEYAEEG